MVVCTAFDTATTKRCDDRQRLTWFSVYKTSAVTTEPDRGVIWPSFGKELLKLARFPRTRHDLSSQNTSTRNPVVHCHHGVALRWSLSCDVTRLRQSDKATVVATGTTKNRAAFQVPVSLQTTNSKDRRSTNTQRIWCITCSSRSLDRHLARVVNVRPFVRQKACKHEPHTLSLAHLPNGRAAR